MFKCSSLSAQHNTNYKSRKPYCGFPKHTLFFTFSKLLRWRMSYSTKSPKRLFPRKYHHTWISSASITFSLSTHISNKSCSHRPQNCAIWRITVLYNIHHLLVTHTNASVFYNRSHSRAIANTSTSVWEPKPQCFGA